VTGGRRGQAQRGAGRQRCAEWMEKKNGEKEGEVGSRRLFMAARWRGWSRKRAEGPGFSAAWRRKRGIERGPGCGGG
jgi:hypothetical protein